MNKAAEERITTQIQGVSEQLCELQVKLDKLTTQVGNQYRNEQRRDKRRDKIMSKEIDDLVAAVTDLTTVEEGIAATIDSTVAFEADLKKKLDAALAAPTVDLAAIKAASASLGTQTAALAKKKQDLADAIVANTPADTGAPA